ncbi:hypothetical protein FRC05_006268 [Tulasnella sp. 425]|nr:hypothetical protein FRC05_006268 [Tulasnella sp. 425]
MGEFVGPDERVYEEIAQPFSQAVQAPGQLEGNGAQQTAGQTAGAMGDIIPTGLLGSALRAVQGVVGSPLGTAPGLPASGQVQPPDAINQFDQAVSGVHQTVSGMVAGSPVAGVVGAASGSLFNSLAGQFAGAAQAAAGSIPVASNGNAAGSTFGILSHPNDASAAAASPSATAVSSVDTRSPGNPNVDPSAESALGNDGADEENGDNDDGEDDRDSEDDGVEGKDPTDDNDDSTSNNLFHG